MNTRLLLFLSICLAACAPEGPYVVDWECSYGCGVGDPEVVGADIRAGAVVWYPETTPPSLRRFDVEAPLPGCLYLEPLQIVDDPYGLSQPLQLCRVADTDDSLDGVVGWPRPVNGGELTIWRVTLTRSNARTE